jgi:signal transduction histidine kinase
VIATIPHPPPADHEALLARLHDTTLQALEFIALGGDLDEPAFCPEVRLIARREASALRELIEGTGDAEAGTLEQELRDIVREARDRAPHDIRLVLGPCDGSVSGRDAGEIAAAVREALTNARKHAAAHRVVVYAEAIAGSAVVSVRDDGIGADLDRLRPGTGVRGSLVRRMERIGGSAELRSAPGEGMLVTLRCGREAGQLAA